jgi:hypothetical protein|tara:strand:+ start:373 stop:1185 length:813 start_codon:yes stop_codon:yes gene_type:complete
MLGLGNTVSSFEYLQTTYASTKSISFDGTDDLLQLPSGIYGNASLKRTGTISLWFQLLNPNDSNNSQIMLRMQSGLLTGLDVDDEIFIMYHKFHTRIQYTYKAGNNEVLHIYDIPGSSNNSLHVYDDGWTHLVCTWQWNGSAAVTNFYVNGSLVEANTTTGSQYEIDSQFTVATIGNNTPALLAAGGNTAFMDGDIDQFAIWTTALDANAVTAIYNSGSMIDLTQNTGNYTSSGSLIGLYEFEDDLKDSSGQGNDITTSTGTSFVLRQPS